jgi:flagellar hook-length control protein FliK
MLSTPHVTLPSQAPFPQERSGGKEQEAPETGSSDFKSHLGLKGADSKEVSPEHGKIEHSTRLEKDAVPHVRLFKKGHTHLSVPLNAVPTFVIPSKEQFAKDEALLKNVNKELPGEPLVNLKVGGEDAAIAVQPAAPNAQTAKSIGKPPGSTNVAPIVLVASESKDPGILKTEAKPVERAAPESSLKIPKAPLDDSQVKSVENGISNVEEKGSLRAKTTSIETKVDGANNGTKLPGTKTLVSSDSKSNSLTVRSDLLPQSRSVTSAKAATAAYSAASSAALEGTAVARPSGIKSTGDTVTPNLKKEDLRKGSDSETLTGSLESTGGTSKATASFTVGQAETSVVQDRNSVPQLFQRVDSMIHQGGGKMVVSLNPPELGQVEVQVVAKGKRIEIEMKSDSERTKTLLQNHVSDLKHSMQSHDLVLSKMDVQVARETSQPTSPEKMAANAGSNQFSGTFQQSFQERSDSGRLAMLGGSQSQLSVGRTVPVLASSGRTGSVSAAAGRVDLRI